MKITGGILAGASVALIVILCVVGLAPSYIVLPRILLKCQGLGLLVAGLRQRPQEAAGTAGTPVAAAAMPRGWYPATDGTGRVMCWNGTQWADPPSGSATSG